MAERARWSSRLGFILAASGSAIGLGNIVFFSANAYRFGAGAFYVPYLLALVAVGLPVLLLELGLGGWSGKSFPTAMHRAGGRPAELMGWFGLITATLITMYYTTILGWVLGMWVGAWGDDLWAASVALPAFGLDEGAVPNPVAYFFRMLGSWSNVLFVVLVWVANAVVAWQGAKSIEKAVRIFVPLMWLFMVVLIVRGLTLEGGMQGAYLLFTPDWTSMADPQVWKGAFSQIFFTLSLGLGIMTTYASYLPEKSDQTASGLMIATMNSAFEFLAGLAVFSLVFAFAMVPKASTLSMMFFVVPEGIASFPTGAKAFGVLFFTLLLLAGLSSSVSLVESLAAAVLDKFQHLGLSRRGAVFSVLAAGMAGSVVFAWPKVIDPALEGNGTLGLTLLDLIDHWAFGYGLLITGLAECLVVGWLLGPEPIRRYLDAHGTITLGRPFDWTIKYLAPVVLIALIVLGLWREAQEGLYGASTAGAGRPMAVGAVVAWLIAAGGGGLLLTFGAPQPEVDA